MELSLRWDYQRGRRVVDAQLGLKREGRSISTPRKDMSRSGSESQAKRQGISGIVSFILVFRVIDGQRVSPHLYDK